MDRKKIESVRIETPMGNLESDSGNHFIDILTIVGIIKKNGESTINPNSNTKLSTSDKLLLIGSYDKIKKFEENLPPV